MLAPIPVRRYLVPDPRPRVPDGFTEINDKMLGGLPHRIRVNAEFNIVVVVPTGLAVTWRDINPSTVVSSGNAQATPKAAPAEIATVEGAPIPIPEVPPTLPVPPDTSIWIEGDTAMATIGGMDEYPFGRDEKGEELGAVVRPSARIIVQRAGTIVASIPLTAGLRRTIPEAEQTEVGGHIELMILGWEIYAGSLRGPGDFGSRISLAWRRADQAVDYFSSPPLNPYVIPRLEPDARLESVSGSPGQTSGGDS